MTHRRNLLERRGTTTQTAAKLPALLRRPVGLIERPIARNALVPVQTAFARPPMVRLALTDGTIDVDGASVPVPRGLARRRLTGEALKVVARVYVGFTLYVERNGALQRVRDRDVVELAPDTKVVSRDERPRVVSRPSFARD